MMDRKDDKEEIMLQLDEIHAQLRLQDLNMNLLAKEIVGMDFYMLNLDDVHVALDEGQPSNHCWCLPGSSFCGLVWKALGSQSILLKNNILEILSQILYQAHKEIHS